MATLKPGEHTFDANGTRIRYRIAGSGPVLMVQPPGWGVGAGIYEATFQALEKEFTVVYHDPQGSGASQHPADARRLNVGTFAADLEALRIHLGLDSFLLAGHSHGGLIALHYALRHPTRVQRLLLLSAQLVGVPGHPAEPDPAPDPGNAELQRTLDRLHTAGGFEALFHLRSDKECTQFLRELAPIYFLDLAHASLLRGFLQDRLLPVRTLQAVSASDGEFALRDLGQLAVPTLAVSGRHDLLCPPGPARRLAEAAQQAQWVTFEGSAHFPWVEEPQAFLARVRPFLHGAEQHPGARLLAR